MAAVQSRGRRGWWGLALFTAISLVAYDGFRLLPPLSASLRQALGPPPPVNLMHGALLLYTFAAALLTLARMMKDEPPKSLLLPVAYLSAFYAFYHLAGALAAHFWAIFAAGTMVLVLAQYHAWTHCSEQARLLRQRVEILDRTIRTLQRQG